MARFHGTHFQADLQWRAAMSALGIEVAADWANLKLGEIRSRSAFGTVACVPLPDGGRIFFKAEQYSLRQRFKYWLRPARTTVEAFAYEYMQNLGIPTLTTLAWGERRYLGLPLSSFIVTLEVPQSQDLREFGIQQWRHLQKPQQAAIYAQLAGQLAEQLHTAHAHGFVHHDLKWRNVLVHQTGEGLRPVWIDAPRAAVWRWRRQRGRIVDLADLAGLAVELVSPHDRMRFLLRYLGRQRQPGQAAALWRKIERRLQRRRSRRHELG